MVQPIQYQIPGVSPDPFAGVLQGLRLGATLQELDLARAAQQQKLAQQQAQAEQQRQANEAMSAYLAKPSGQRTLEDTRGLIRFLPAEQVKNLIDIDSRLSQDERRNQVLFAGQVGSALRLGNTDVALQMVRQRAEAETDPMKKQGFQILAQSIEKAPEAALETLRVSTTALGKDYEPAAKAMFGAPAEQGRMISTPADKIKAGLVNDKGAPLPGTFFQEPGKEPKLITGEKPQELPAEIRTMQALGFPVTPEGWAAYTAQKRGPLVKVDVGDRAEAAYGQQVAKEVGTEDVQLVKAARAAPESVKKVDNTLRQLYSSKALTGAFADSIKAIERVRAKFGSDYAAGRVSDTEVLDAMLGSDVFPMIGELGIGARGLDTPAEREFLRQVMTGTVAMDRNSLVRLAEMRRDRIERSVQNYNQMLDEGELDRYFAATGRKKKSVNLPPRLPRPSNLLPPVGREPAAPAAVTPEAPPRRRVEGRVTPMAAPAESFAVTPQPTVTTESIDAMVDRWRSKYGIGR